MHSDNSDNTGGTCLPNTPSPSPRLPRHILTMGWTSALDGDDERGLLGANAITDMTHVLSGVRWGHLRDPEAGAHDLEEHMAVGGDGT